MRWPTGLLASIAFIGLVVGKPSEERPDGGVDARATPTNHSEAFTEGLNLLDNLYLLAASKSSGEPRTDVNGVEECLANKALMSKGSIDRLLRQRRRLAQSIKKINRQQNMFCRVDENVGEVPYRKCPVWRQQKWGDYHSLIRLTYCSEPSRWPDAPSIADLLEDIRTGTSA